MVSRSRSLGLIAFHGSAAIDWLIPGLRTELITALIRDRPNRSESTAPAPILRGQQRASCELLSLRPMILCCAGRFYVKKHQPVAVELS